ncbi:MAG TPA: AGE family epimerase/isomerase [Humisphaera sp.]|jgi:mannobiose 2-epimerase|nr:AGE family epimerase/isomerase [Humisphaera sp.]
MVTTSAVSLAAEAPSPEAYLRIAAEAEANLQKQILDKWFPVADDDQAGGFYENYREDWTREQTGQKSIVYQSRLTWLSAGAAMRYPAKVQMYAAQSRRGAAILADKLWDKERGGFYWQVDDAGKPSRQRPNEKHVYGNAFGMYALATNYQLTHDTAALELAKKTFDWLEEHAHDARNGGYFEALTLEGKPIDSTTRGNDAIGTAFGRKSMNTHIHLLEALTTLYAVWPDDKVRTRLEEVYELGLTKIYSDPGYLRLFFTPDWTPIETRDSFGHDIETAFLLAEAAAALGKPDDARAWTAGRKLVDHALEIGFDREHGGFYNEGALDGSNMAKEKIWWVQAEGLNALLLMHERFGMENPKYWDAFVQQCDFISKHQIDATHGGWYSTVRPDGTSIPNRNKSDMWTEGYHQGRSMLSVSGMLRKMAGEK